MKKTVLFLGVFLLLTQCKVNQFTGKKTLQIYGNKTVLPKAFKAYDDFITTNKVIRNTTASNQIQHVGKKITLQPKLILNTNKTSAISMTMLGNII